MKKEEIQDPVNEALQHAGDFERISEEPLRAMWFDTEQSRCTTKRILTDRIGGLLGDGQFPDEQFYVFNVRNHTPKERIEMLALAIETYKPDICIIDDLLDDINSGPASVELMQRLLTIASVNKCNITAMIHLNRSGEKLNLRGWIGTVMVQKSYEVFNCDRNPKTHVFSLGLTFSRRYYLEEPMYYVYDGNGLPTVTDEPEDTREGRKDWSAGKDLTAFNKEFTDEHASDPYLPWDFRKLFGTAMGGAATLGYDELERRVMDLSGIRQKQYYYRVFDAAARAVMQSVFWEDSPPIHVSAFLELNATPAQKRRKIDLLDYVMEVKSEQF